MENQPVWPTHLRSRSVLRSKPVRHLADPSLAVAAVRATAARLLRDLDFLGLLFESMVVRDLRVSSPWTNPHEHRDRRGAGLARRDEGRIAALFARGATQSEALERWDVYST